MAPPVCALCQADGQRAHGPWGLDLCIHCEAACPTLRHPCPQCAEPLAPGGNGCPRCRSQSRQFDAAHCAFLYADPVDQLVTGLKFGHELAFARVLGTLLAHSLRHRRDSLPDCILPMPLHRQRHIERGFNQAAEIARHLSRRTGMAVNTRLLERVRATLPQSDLTAAARERNMAGAFRVRTGQTMPRHIALLDDVLTTGSTVNAAARALREAGAQHIEVWACARATRQGE